MYLDKYINFYSLTKTKMKQKVVKLEIGKVVAIVIAVVVVTFAAGFYIQSSYFQGMVGVEKTDSQAFTLIKEVGKINALVNRPNVSDKTISEAFELFGTELGKQVGKENADRTIAKMKMLPKQDLAMYLSAFRVNLGKRPISEAYQIFDDATKSF